MDFQTDARFDNPRAVQLRLPSFDQTRLVEVGIKVRDLYVTDCSSPDRVRQLASDEFVVSLARAVAGKLGGKVGIAPRLFLKKLVSDVLDRIDQFEDFDPRKHYALTISEAELLPVERQAMGASTRRRDRAGIVSHFDSLHPALQHHIVNSLGWRSLRPFQDAVIPRILAGEHVVVLAPTAGGKTEAAFLPVLSRMLSEDWQGLSVLYLCPIKALLNNLEFRLTRYCSLVGRRAALWHGDVGSRGKEADSARAAGLRADDARVARGHAGLTQRRFAKSAR